jgi:hypothetical protein
MRVVGHSLRKWAWFSCTAVARAMALDEGGRETQIQSQRRLHLMAGLRKMDVEARRLIMGEPAPARWRTHSLYRLEEPALPPSSDPIDQRTISWRNISLLPQVLIARLRPRR